MSNDTPKEQQADRIDEASAECVGADTRATKALPPSAEVRQQASAGLHNSSGFEAARQLASGSVDTGPTLINKRFLLEDVVGEGGMGTVYRARDLRKVEAEDTNPFVAVKLLSPKFREHPHALVTLQQEAVKSQKLAHPNIVTVYDFDRDGDSIYMTMELLKGDPLDQLIKLEAPFSKEVAFRYFKELCAGLEYAHKRGLVHCDFKPGNVFVTAAGVVKILDFGIARAVSGDVLSHDYDAGSLGALTPDYATVEMAEGKPPTFSDDIYALACVFYEMLTGDHPFGRMSAVKARGTRLKPRRPEGLEQREWRTLRAGLSFSAKDRPQTISEFRGGVLGEKRKSRLWLWASMGVLLIGTMVSLLVMIAHQAAQEEILRQHVESAKNCFIRGDYGCAIENALVARSLSPGDAEAEQLLANARRMQAELPIGEIVGQRERLERETEAEITRLFDEIAICMAANDHECALPRLGLVLDAEPDEPRAIAILRQIREAPSGERGKSSQ